MANENNIFDNRNLDLFGKDYVKIIAELLKAAGKNASGELIKSLDFRLQGDAEKILYALEANDYFDEVDQGRKPGSYPPISKIAEWTKIKGIDEGAAFPIARKIYKFGIPPTNIIDKATQKILNDPALISKMESAGAENLEEYLAQFFKENK